MVDDPGSRRRRDKDMGRNHCIHVVAAFFMMGVCLYVLSWSRNKLHIPTYRSSIVASMSLSDFLQQFNRDPTKDPPSTKKVLMVSYNRGGSTFFSETFNRNPNAFNWFEPLAAIFDDKYGKNSHNMATIVPGDSFFQKDFTAFERRAMFNVLHDIFKCDLRSLPSSLYAHRFMTKPAWMKSNKMQTYKACILQHPSKNRPEVKTVDRKEGPDRNISTREIPPYADACLDELTSECQESKIRAIKTIRLRMSMVGDLLDADPDIKIFYLVRDPRGILSSRHRTHQHDDIYNLRVIGKAADNLCKIMRQDKADFWKLKSLYRKKLLQIKYEDLATNPLQTTVQIYNFLGLSVPERVLVSMHKLTHGADGSGAIDTRRSNATTVSTAWMDTFSKDVTRRLQKNCLDVIRYYGYPVV